MVKSAKRCLRKSIGRQSLTFDELSTLVVEVEYSRPLSYVSEEDADGALTPSHLLTGHRVLSLPDPTVTDEEDPDYEPSAGDLSRRMQHLRKTFDQFWDRWKREYLQELREQHTSESTQSGIRRGIQEGEPVILYDENQPRGLWRLGRVTELISSTDDHIRATKVKVMSTTGRPTILQPSNSSIHWRPEKQAWTMEPLKQKPPQGKLTHLSQG